MSHPNPDDRAQVIHWAQSVVADPQVVYLDTETTGLDDTAEVIELAIIDADGNTLCNRRFKPAGPIPADASAIHGIFDRDVAACSPLTDCWPEIRGLLRGTRVVVYNAEFDKRLIWQSLGHYRDLAHTAIPGSWECAMEAYAAWYGAWSPWHGSYTYKPLSFAAAATGDAPDHSALGDARACRAVVRRLAVEET
jgi:DNA polymerase III subunit epsilon